MKTTPHKHEKNNISSSLTSKKKNHIYWEGGIEMAPRIGSTNMMSKSCQYLVFIL
jgi:hypothetical protein